MDSARIFNLHFTSLQFRESCSATEYLFYLRLESGAVEGRGSLPSRLDRKDSYVALPVTAPVAAGLCLTVWVRNALPDFMSPGPQASTSTMCQSTKLWKLKKKKN